MMKISLAVAIAAAVLTPAPLLVGTFPAEAQNLKMAQGVDVQIGRDRDRRRNDSDATVGIGLGGVTVGPRQNCRMVTTTVERPDGHTITRAPLRLIDNRRTEMAPKPRPFFICVERTVVVSENSIRPGFAS